MKIQNAESDVMCNEGLIQKAKTLKCFKTELVSVEQMTIDELFDGFDSIKAITFSYDLNFIDRILSKFKFGEVILGADFMVEKDDKISGFLLEVLTNAHEAGQVVSKRTNLMKMVADGSMTFKTPNYIMDHRKIYLLKADDGRTRVIKASANMTGNAWNGSHMEFYEYDDTEFCYESYLKDFEDAWSNSQEIPMSVATSKNADDLIEGNAILKGVKETGRTVVLKAPEENEIRIENIKFVIDHETAREKHKVLLEGVNAKAKNGVYQIAPKVLEKIENNHRKIMQKTKVKVANVEQQYPAMTFDYETKEAFLNGEKRDLNPTEEEIKKDVAELTGIFNNFDEFVDENGQLKQTHYKLLNALFVSPFISKLRCQAFLRGVGTTSLPLFLLSSSGQANCGKTFTTRVALKMMTGKMLTPENKEDCKKDHLRDVQLSVKSTPFFVDELDNAFLSRIKDIIKNPEKCEENQLESQPMLVFASNDVVEPDETIRKRMVFLKFDGALPSSVDQNKYKSRGNAIVKRIGTAFYREYTRRMLDEMNNLLNYMIHEKNIPDTWYPDIMKISSQVIVNIFNQYSENVPEYVKVLTWNDDYFGANCIAENAIRGIKAEYKFNKKAFTITKDSVTIELGSDKESGKKLESWKNTLPAEMVAKLSQTRDSARLTMNRRELENRLGFKFKTSLFGR